jgi:hypothetical protein
MEARENKVKGKIIQADADTCQQSRSRFGNDRSGDGTFRVRSPAGGGGDAQQHLERLATFCVRLQSGSSYSNLDQALPL